MINRPFVAAASMLAAAILVTAPAHASAALTHATVHLLAGPAPTFGPIADVPGNSQVGVLWCGPANFDWCLIQFHKKQGWVHSGDLSALAGKGIAVDAGAGNGGSDGGINAPGGSAGGSSKPAEARVNGGSRGATATSVGAAGVHKLPGF